MPLTFGVIPTRNYFLEIKWKLHIIIGIRSNYKSVTENYLVIKSNRAILIITSYH
jgi:hypothetical protein